MSERRWLLPFTSATGRGRLISGRRGGLIQRGRRFARCLGQGDAKLICYVARNVDHTIAGLIFVEKHLAPQDRIQFLLGRHLVNRGLKLFEQRLHHFPSALLHLLLLLLGGLLELLSPPLKFALSLSTRGIVKKGLLLLELLELLLKLLAALLELSLLLLHFLLHLLLHLLHPRHARQHRPLVDVAELLGLRRHRDEGGEKEKNCENS